MGGMYEGSLSQDWNRGHAERTMGTWGQKRLWMKIREDAVVLVEKER